MTPRLLVYENAADCPVDRFGPWLEAAGLVVEVYRAHAEEPRSPESVRRYAGLLVLGGEMSARDDHLPHIAGAKQWLVASVAAGIPTLGICLGHQLLAEALGGSTGVNPHGQRLGLLPVTPTEDGADDTLLAGLDHGPGAIHFNHDVVSQLPGDARLLATAPGGEVQAVRYGPCAWGVQWHPEASAELLLDWVRDYPPGERADQAASVVARVRAESDALERAWRPLAERFARVIREHAAAGAVS